MIIHDVVQGTAEWGALRASCFTASEAPAMAGVSKYQNRSELLAAKYTGEIAEVTSAQQRIFDKGHAAEASARPIAERIIGEELYPCTATHDEHQWLLASFDGCTMLEDVIFEHKLINADLRQATVETLAEHYKVQMDQQLAVSGAEKCLFMASNGTEADCNWFWYETTPERIEAVLAGWAQFKADLEAYAPTNAVVKPEGKVPDSLPALSINIAGGVQASNLPDFKAAALALIDGIKTELVTDQDFSDAESATKWLQKGEKQLKASKDAALQQTADINTLFQTLDELAEQMRQKRLTLEKVVKAEKTNRRNQIQRDAEQAFRDWMTQQAAPVPVSSDIDVVGAMKGKKTIISLQAAADDEVARAKIDASKKIERLKSNAKLLDEQAEGYGFLFSDRQTLLTKASDDLAATIKSRIADHKAAEQKRQDAERARIRQEEADKVQREAAEAESQRQAEEAEKRKPEPAPQTEPEPLPAAAQHKPLDTSRINAAADSFQRGSQIKAPEQVTISRKEYERLLAAEAKLDALEAHGVDNWTGYGDAMQELNAA